VGVLLLALGACKPAPPARVIALSTSLPLMWREAGDMRGQLVSSAAPHWAMTLLQKRGQVRPLDTLAGPAGVSALPRGAMLVLVQPQPLMPEENLALDTWVRGGGHVLLFVDPMLTFPTAFALGDPRGPQRVAMLSPILRHWGLELQFDLTQPAGEQSVSVGSEILPVNLAGRFAVHQQASCALQGANIIATCRIGRGEVLAVADAAVFDGDDAGRKAVLAELMDQAQP
jgi:hypothetical protein